MSFIRLTSAESSHTKLSKWTELDVIAVSVDLDGDQNLISLLVSLDESVDSAIRFFEENSDKLRKFLEKVDGTDPYFELFIDYKPSKNDSQQSEPIALDLIHVLAEHNIRLVVTVMQLNEATFEN